MSKTKTKPKTFKFCEKNTDEIKKFIETLEPKKSCQKFDMITNILDATFFAKCICDNINALIRFSKFDNKLREVDNVPMHTKRSKFSKENSSILSILPNISKIHERYLYDQILNIFEDVFLNLSKMFFSKYAVFT